MSDEEGAARQALAAFGVEAKTIEPVARSENITFHVETAGGEGYALRLHRPGYNTLPELISERVWTRALAAAGFAVPVGLKTLDGADYAPVTLGDGEVREAGLTRWTEGQVLRRVIEDEHLDPAPWFVRLGGIAADLHTHSAAWTPPAGFTRRVLDADGLMGEWPSWGPFWEHAALTPGEQALMAATRVKLHAALSALPRDRQHFGMIHADLHHGNLLIDGDKLSVIDFDDAAFGWYLYDLAVALVHHQRREDFAQLQGALLAGYRARRALSAEDEARLPMFLLARRLGVIGWLHQRPEVDAGDYLAEMKPLTLALCEEEIHR
ncbi:MAG TPA: phosphotransferase [Caulobacteraceae bacterium]